MLHEQAAQVTTFQIHLPTFPGFSPAAEHRCHAQGFTMNQDGGMSSVVVTTCFERQADGFLLSLEVQPPFFIGWFMNHHFLPIGSMYGIFTYI